MPPVADFEGAVLEILAAVREGEVISYGELASAAGHRGAARAVGNLLKGTAEPVPWWRVVRADGRLVAPNLAEQVRKLTREGVTVRDGRVVAGGPLP
ncbi:MAG: MGMT family protein [Acidimicrobiia bacterium]|nr:MGMT family protein [Acidimicrobiia bacterium]